MNDAQETPPPPVVGQQVPTGKRFLWGLGGVTDFTTYYGLNGLLDPIYVNAMGLDPKIIGLARGLPRLFDLITDPLLGHFSDNTRTRWGRRRPWMAAGAIVSATAAVVMWHPPLHGAGWMTTAFIVGMMVILFTFGYSMFTIPYAAQGYELSTGYNERTHIFKWRQYAAMAAGFLTPWFVPLCLAIEGPRADVTRGTDGVLWVSWGIAALILLSACGPIFGCRESGRHAAERKTRFFDAIRLTVKNKAFWPLVAGNFAVRFGTAVTTSFFYYIMVYNVSAGNNQAGTTRLAVFYNSINIAAFLAMGLVVRFTDRAGKKTSLSILMLLSAFTYASLWFTLQPQKQPWVLAIAGFLSGAIHVPPLIATIWPALLTGVCIGVFTNSMPPVINSMVADVCDVDELACGQQRQAFYGAVFVTCDKIAMAVAVLLQGFLVAGSGYSAKLAVQSPQTIGYWMKALLLTQPAGFFIGFLCILAFPCTRAKMLEVRRLLQQQRARG